MIGTQGSLNPFWEYRASLSDLWHTPHLILRSHGIDIMWTSVPVLKLHLFIAGALSPRTRVGFLPPTQRISRAKPSPVGSEVIHLRNRFWVYQCTWFGLGRSYWSSQGISQAHLIQLSLPARLSLFHKGEHLLSSQVWCRAQPLAPRALDKGGRCCFSQR